MEATLKLTEDGLIVELPAVSRESMSIAATFLIVVMKAERFGSHFLIAHGDLGRALEAVIRFCDKNSIALELDYHAKELLSNLVASRREFEESYKQGMAPVSAAGDLPLGSFVRKLTPKQTESVAHLLAVQNGANFSVPGAGKTTIAYAAFAALKEQGVVDRIIVIAPRAAFWPWEEEFEACFGRSPLSARLTVDREARERIYSRSDEYELFLVTYQMAANDLRRLAGLCRRHAIFLVLDESHHVKRFEEGQWADAVLALAPNARRRLILSGTPMPQGLEDLWTQFTFLWPTRSLLGERSMYRRLCEREAIGEIQSHVRPFFRRIKKSELDLPPLTVENIDVDLAPSQHRIYEAIQEKILRDTGLQPADKAVLRQWRRARLIRLLQAASNPALLSEYSEEFQLPTGEALDISIVEIARRYGEFELPAKFVAGLELVRTLISQQKKVVVWTSFVKNIDMFFRLVSHLAPTFIVFGGVPRDYSEDEEFNREQQISQFKKTEGPAILVANPAACGESVSLHHACRDAIYLDRTFDCAKFLQSQNRIHRFGLGPQELVKLYVIRSKDTIDETVDSRLKAKAERMYRLLEDELPQGTFTDIDDSEDEELRDFSATIRKIRRHAS